VLYKSLTYLQNVSSGVLEDVTWRTPLLVANSAGSVHPNILYLNQ